MKWLIFFLMLPHLKPASLEYLWPSVESLFNIGRLVSTVIIIFLFILKKRIPSKPVCILAILQLWLLLVTYLQDYRKFQGALIGVASILAVAMLIDFFSVYVKSLLHGLLLDMEFLIYINLMSVLLYYPNGIYRSAIRSNVCYFLGYHNSFIIYVLPAILIAVMYMRMIDRNGRPIALIVAGILSIVITWSATSICGLLIFAAILLLSRTVVNKWITYPVIFASTVTVDVLISVFRVMDRILLFTVFIESFLRKSVTLTGRIHLWDSFYQRFFDSPWIGYGKGSESIVGTGLSAHNQWFQFLLEGGIVGLIIFLVFNLIIGKQLMQYKNSSFSSIFYASFAALYILFVADVYLSSPWLYIIYILAYHIDKFETAPIAGQFQISKIKRGHHVPNRKLPEKH